MYYKDNGQIKLAERGKRFPEHPLAGIVPLATDSEQAVLTEDIKEHGLREPIILWEGQIVDGRCRQKACLATNTQLVYVELKDDLSSEEVALLVKSLNTRRNLTHTQKTMVAAKESLKPGTSSAKQAKAWGVSEKLVKNARWLWKNRPTEAQALFDGKAIELEPGNITNRVSPVYNYFRKLEEKKHIQEPMKEHGYKDDSLVKSQTGKMIYNTIAAKIDKADDSVYYDIIELVNELYPNKETSDHSIEDELEDILP